MGGLLTALSYVAGLVALICFIMVLIKMFQHGHTGLGIACIVLIFCGIGGLVALIYGWMKVDEWKIKNLMLAYTISFVLSILLSIPSIMAGVPAAPGG